MFDFKGLAIILATISFGLCGLMLAGSVLFPEQAEKAKRTHIPNIFIGLILVAISATVLAFFA